MQCDKDYPRFMSVHKHLWKVFVFAHHFYTPMAE